MVLLIRGVAELYADPYLTQTFGCVEWFFYCDSVRVHEPMILLSPLLHIIQFMTDVCTVWVSLKDDSWE